MIAPPSAKPVDDEDGLPRPEVLRSLSHWGAFRAEVRNGRLHAVHPFEHDPHPSDLIHAWPEMLQSAQRIPTPLVRRGWLRGDAGAGRGRDEFLPMAWDDALDHVSKDIARVRLRYGNAAIFGGSYGWASAGRLHHASTLLHRFLNCVGGYTASVTNYSYGAAMAFLPHVLGSAQAVAGPVTTWRAVARHTELLLAFGGLAEKNWAVHAGGAGQHRYPDWMAMLRERKVEILNLSPHREDVPAALRAEWMPVRPCTDTALVLALAHCLARDGREDAAFLSRYCVGYARLRDYLMGVSDGLPKTPQWAAPITGVDAHRIEALARRLAGRRVMLTAAWSLQRAQHGEQPYWAIIALACMLGQVGLPGGGFAFGYGSMGGMGNPGYQTPVGGLSKGSNPVSQTIPVARIADMLLHPGQAYAFDGQRRTYPDIRLVYWAGGNPFHHHQDLNRLRRAFRQPETVVVHEPFWTATARHADIVLPATTALERNDIGGSSRDAYLLAMHRIVAPVGQARDDYTIFAQLAGRLGVAQAFTEGRTAEQWLPVLWQGMRDALCKRGMRPPDFDTFWKTGYFRLDEPQEDFVLLADFRADPSANPLRTPSGRIALYSEAVAGFGYAGQPGHPVWLPAAEWLGAEAAQRFPLHLVTPQPAERLHGQMDASALSRAAKRAGHSVLRMHGSDAAARGIREGDRVRIFNDRGACLAVVHLTDALMPGVVMLPTGATFDPDDSPQADGALDRHGNPNVLTRDEGTSELGQGCAAQSCLVQVRRDDGPAQPVQAFYTPWMA